MPVPVRNLYFLLCYAWDHLEARELVDVGSLPSDRPVDLLASCLLEGMNGLLRRGLDRGYVAFEEESRRIRGKLLLGRSIARQLLGNGLAACAYDELQHDVLHNQILKSTLVRLASCAEIDTHLRRKLATLSRRLPPIREIDLEPLVFSRVRFHRNIAHYRFLIHVCLLLYENLLPEAGREGRTMRDFRGDERQMGLLFEAFIRNFLRREQKDYRVKRDTLRWDATAEGEGMLAFLPTMQTDTSLRRDGQHVVVETKFTTAPLRTRREATKLRADHLYQLFSYLRNASRNSSQPAAGVLLYARTNRDIDVRLRLGPHPVWVRTLDLNAPWHRIRSDLLGLVGDLMDGASYSVAAQLGSERA